MWSSACPKDSGSQVRFKGHGTETVIQHKPFYQSLALVAPGVEITREDDRALVVAQYIRKGVQLTLQIPHTEGKIYRV